MDWQDIDSLVTDLDTIRDMAIRGHRRWTEVWDQIRLIGRSFKQTRYPTKSDKDNAWNRFQRVVTDIKQQQSHQRDEGKTFSSQHRANIFYDAHMARAWFTEHPIIDMIIWSSLERHTELQAASRNMQAAWTYFTKYKNDMTIKDKKEVFAELRRIQDCLDSYWKEHKRAREQDRGDRAVQIEVRIQKHNDKLSRLYDAQHRTESNIEKLKNMLSTAQSDEFRDTVSGWLVEAEDKLNDISTSIEKVQGWLDEDREKLSQLR